MKRFFRRRKWGVQALVTPIHYAFFMSLCVGASCQTLDTLATRDVDGDGIMDLLEPNCVDNNKKPGASCDDLDPATSNDVYDCCCNCAGELVDGFEQYLSTNLTDFQNASEGDWVEITEAEKDNIMANFTNQFKGYNGVTTDGTDTRSNSTWTQINTQDFTAGYTPVVILVCATNSVTGLRIKLSQGIASNGTCRAPAGNDSKYQGGDYVGNVVPEFGLTSPDAEECSYFLYRGYTGTSTDWTSTARLAWYTPNSWTYNREIAPDTKYASGDACTLTSTRTNSGRMGGWAILGSEYTWGAKYPTHPLQD